MLQLRKQKVKYLATSAALTAVENKIPDVSNLVKKKKNYEAAILGIKSK